LPTVFIRYYFAVALASLAMGIHTIVMPWLAAGELHLAPQQLAWVQASGLFPVFLFMLLGGAWSDRAQSAKFLPALYFVLMLCTFGLLYVIRQSNISFYSLLAYALLVGGIMAFVQPLRERLLPNIQRLSSNQYSLQLSVIQIGLAVYVTQAIGVVIAGQMDLLGVEVVLIIQAGTILTVSVLFFSLRLKEIAYGEGASTDHIDKNVLFESKNPIEINKQGIKSGLNFVWQNSTLRQLIILVTFNGFMHIGVFIVVLPIMVRDVYNLGAGYFAALQLCFVVGNIAATLGLLKRGETQSPGREVLFSLLYSGVLMLAIAAEPKTTGLYFLVFFWGMVAGTSANLGKALLQQTVSEEYRGRAISIYSLALLGAAPLGALSCGYALNYIDAFKLFSIAGFATLFFFCCFLFSKTLWSQQHNPKG
jgi:hypothetical protein